MLADIGVFYCKAHPDEKGIETALDAGVETRSWHCKAHPDEKGIETSLSSSPRLISTEHCKAHPDEKGIETPEYSSCLEADFVQYCKAHPDEKGIETVEPSGLCWIFTSIAKHIPTKRELKRKWP